MSIYKIRLKYIYFTKSKLTIFIFKVITKLFVYFIPI